MVYETIPSVLRSKSAEPTTLSLSVMSPEKEPVYSNEEPPKATDNDSDPP